MKHTPGKWFPVGNIVELDNEQSADICSVFPPDWGQTMHGRDDDEMRANARLIAAAPDMLAALQGLLASDSADMYAIVGRDVDGHPLNAAGVARMNARAAIAKAIPA